MTCQIKYDVFISFRGLDTRRGFLSHLHKALCHKQIEVYVDYRLKEGSELLPSLFKAIEESQIALIIFSKDYVVSKWCLEELAKINECRVNYGQIVVPIFYDVDPSDVRHQKGNYQKAFAPHGNIMDLEKWRVALKSVANLSGFHSKNFGTEAELIEAVVQRVLTRLNQMHQVDLKGLIGINKPIADLQPLVFCNESEDVRVIAIWGMGGIGKTTIASALFNTLCSEFDDCCFLSNVREQSQKYGTIQLRDKLVSTLLGEEDLNIGVPNGLPAHILRRLGRKKVLVVLDDVSNANQVENLVGIRSHLGSGSRVIVTTRDKHVISKEADGIYEVKALGDDDALNLLKLHAFNGKCLQVNWHDPMREVVEYAKGIPLALKVLGSFLYGKSAQEWKSQMQKLQKMPFAEVQNALRLSYEGLDREESEIFLYIACFFENGRKRDIRTLLDACGYSTAITFKTLQDRALINISSSIFEYVHMHDLIREMGREIVREQSIEKPGDRSHLWDPNDICRVLKQCEGSDHIESITMNLSTIRGLSISCHSFARMVNLNFLRFYNDSNETKGKVLLPKGLSILPHKIKLLHWDSYPSKSLPKTFNAENLIELRMRDSLVEKLWDGVQNLKNLEMVDLTGSKQLTELPDFSKATSLRKLYLTACVNLLSVHPSIFSLQKLFLLKLNYCAKLEELPDTKALPKLEYLDLSWCTSLKHLSEMVSKMRFLDTLSLEGCKQLDTSNLHMLFDGLRSLINLGGCSKLYELPENISNLSSLRYLKLERTNVKRLPESIKHVSRLDILILTDCKRLRSLPQIPASVRILEASYCESLERLFTPTPELVEERFRLLGTDSYAVCLFRSCPKLDEDALHAFSEYFKGIPNLLKYLILLN